VPSPWEAALGEHAEGLRPELRAYFAAIPPGAVGIGTGVFDRVGTPHPWLRPLLRLAGGPSLFPIRAHDVPFDVRNRAVPGIAGVAAQRRIHLPGRTLTMRDETVATTPGVVVDRIGLPPRLEVAFRPSVVEGDLRLVSFRVRLRLGPFRLPLGPLSPRVVLTERFDPEAGRQRVALHVDAPLIGRIYEYAGSFVYGIRQEREDR
jgi:hypothetical protein